VIFVQFNYKNHYCIFLKDSYNYCESVIVAKSLTADTLVLLYVINELRLVRSSYQKQNYSNWSLITQSSTQSPSRKHSLLLPLVLIIRKSLLFRFIE
jgi:hypothetical protein